MKAPLLLVLATLVLVSGCELPSSVKPEVGDMTPSSEFAAPGTEAIWEIVMYELDEAQLRIDDRLTKPRAGHFETIWANFPSPYRFEGERKKVLGDIVPVEDKPGFFQVYLTTWVQRNASEGDPLELSQAIWQDVEPDQAITSQLIYRIERHFTR